MHRNEKFFIAITMLFVILFAGSSAYAVDCYSDPTWDPDWIFNNKNGHKEYRINYNIELPGITLSEFRAAVDIGASVWNEQGGGGHFSYAGTTTRTAASLHGKTLSQCHSDGITFGVVRVVDQASTALAENVPICDGHYFDIQVFTKDANGTPRPWAVGSISGNNRDLAALLAHEFGHSQGLRHPIGGEYAIMGALEPGTTRQRELYEWDFQCLYEVTGKRSLEGRRQTHLSSGGFGSPQSWIYSLFGTTGGITFYWTGSNYQTAFPFLGYNPRFGTVHGANSSIVQDLRFGVAPLGVIFNEDSTKKNRVFYPSFEDSIPFYLAASHRVQVGLSSDGFVNDVTIGQLSHCPNANCTGNTTAIYSGKRLASAYNHSIERTHIAWVNQNRADNAESNAIWISTGAFNDTTLSKPYKLNIRTNVSPGIACHSTLNQCIVAYVDTTQTSNRIRVRRFIADAYASWSPYYHELYWDPITYSLPSGTATASSIAAWYHALSGKFYIAFRSYKQNQPIEVFHSTNGTSWTQSTDTIRDSYVGPSVINHTTGVNYLLTWY